MTPAHELRQRVRDVADAQPTDAVDDAHPRWVARPESVEEVSGALVAATESRWRVTPRGAGTGLGLGNRPEGVDLVLDLASLDRVLEHAAGDLVVTVEAGVRLDELQRTLASAGQRLALDPPGPDATIGGLIANNASGPRRFRYGTVRDLLIGITIVLADGTVAKAGGKVVKNVAGYDFAKLMTGSLGTLGVIVRAVFRLHPLPRATRMVEVEVSNPLEVEGLVQRLLHSSLVPSAIELQWQEAGGGVVAVLFEGVEAGVVAQSSMVGGLLDRPTSVRGGDEATAGWAAFVPSPPTVRDTEIRITCLPANLATVLAAVQRLMGENGVNGRISGSIGHGIMDVHIDPRASTSAVIGLVVGLRTRPDIGHVVVRAAPVALKAELDVWGPVGDALDLMRRVKMRFDPDRILNPGRFVGGI